MKQILFYICVIITLYMVIGGVSNVIIPDEALRIRVIANSNEDKDQEMKVLVKEELQTELYSLLKDTRGVDNARRIINSNLSFIDNRVNNLLTREKYDLDYTINYGLNFFPAKELGGVVYKEGYYESLTITLGSGEGSNWWCILFPPLCLLEIEEDTEIEYTSLVREMINKYL